jgi:hypothetical protein
MSELRSGTFATSVNVAKVLDADADRNVVVFQNGSTTAGDAMTLGPAGVASGQAFTLDAGASGTHGESVMFTGIFAQHSWYVDAAQNTPQLNVLYQSSKEDPNLSNTKPA